MGTARLRWELNRVRPDEEGALRRKQVRVKKPRAKLPRGSLDRRINVEPISRNALPQRSLRVRNKTRRSVSLSFSLDKCSAEAADNQRQAAIDQLSKTRTLSTIINSELILRVTTLADNYTSGA